jgi:hypothetical protein
MAAEAGSKISAEQSRVKYDKKSPILAKMSLTNSHKAFCL